MSAGEGSAEEADMATQWRSFVALGDSFTEGLDDLRADGSPRGWADLLAQDLAESSPNPAQFRYANLAIRGRKLTQIAEEQVPTAVGFRPDLVSLVAGVNDLLRPTFDLGEAELVFAKAVASLRSTGADVLLLIGANPAARSPKLVRIVESRLEGLNDMVRRVAQDQDCLALDLTETDAFSDPRQWSDDRLHLSSQGHHRMAAAFGETLGIGDSAWRQPMSKDSGPGIADRVVDDARWAGRHLAPWLTRRILGRSSGDGREAKRPNLETLQERPLAGAAAQHDSHGGIH